MKLPANIPTYDEWLSSPHLIVCDVVVELDNEDKGDIWTIKDCHGFYSTHGTHPFIATKDGFRVDKYAFVRRVVKIINCRWLVKPRTGEAYELVIY